MERAFKGVWIPKEIWESQELTLQEKVLLTEIDSLDNEDGCFASNKYFAEFMKLSERQIKRIICSVIDKKWVQSKIIYKKDSKEIEQRVLKICRPPYPKKEVQDLVTDMSLPLVTKMVDPGDKNVPDNNTINNIKKEKEKKEKETEFDILINKNFSDEELKNTMYEFIKMRKAIKKPLTTRGLELIINKLEKLSQNKDEQIQILNNSIMNNWQGIFELKESKETEIKKQYNNDFSEYDSFIKSK